LLIVIAIIPVATIVSIQLPVIQTLLCNYAAKKISQKIDGDVSIGRIYYSLPNNLIINDLTVTQRSSGDTVAVVGKIFVHASITSLLTDYALIHRVTVADGYVKIDKINDIMVPLKAIKDKPESVAAVESVIDTSSKAKQFTSITLNRLLIENFAVSTICRDTLHHKIVDRTKRPRKVDWKEFSFSELNVDMRSIVWGDTLLRAEIRNIAGREEHGWNIKSFGGDVSMTGQSIRIDGLHYNDGYSNLVAKYYQMDFESFSKFKDYCHNVSMDVDFDNTLLDFNSLSHFGCSDHLKLRLFVSGRVTGPVCKLQSDSLSVSSGTKVTRLDLSTRITGLPKSKATMASVKVKDLHTTMTDIATIVSEVTKSPNFKKEKIARLAPGESLTFNGSLDGLFTDFVAHGDLNTTSCGNVDVDIICRSDKELGYTLDGFFESKAFELGKFLQNEKLGKLTCDASMQFFSDKNLTMSIEDLHIDEFGYKAKEFNDIDIKGKFSKKKIDLKVDCNDDWVKFGLNVNAFNTNPDDMELTVAVDSLHFIDTTGIFDVGNILLFGSSHPNGSRITMASDVANMEIESETGIATQIERMIGWDYIGVNTKMTVTIDKVGPVLHVFAPDLYIEPGTEFFYHLTEDGCGEGHLISDLIAFKDNFIQNFKTSISINHENTVKLDVNADKLEFGDIISTDNKLCLNFFEKNKDFLSALVDSSNFTLGDVKWEIASDTIDLGNQNFAINKFKIANGDRFLSVDGVLGKGLEDTLKIRLNDMNLDDFKSIVGKNVNLRGNLNGEAKLFSTFGEDAGFIADIRCDSITANTTKVGDFHFKSLWNPEKEHIDISVLSSLDNKNTLNLDGYFRPKGKELSVSANLDSFKLAVIEPFVAGAISDVGGSISGNIGFSSVKDSVSILSKGVNLDDMNFVLDFTKVKYTISGPVNIDNNGILLDRLILTDQNKNKGTIAGGLYYDRLKDIRLDTKISLDQIMGLNTTALDNNSFYGKAYASGSVSISGPLDRLTLDIDVLTDKNTSVHIPISSSGKEQISTLRFKNSNRQFSSSFDSLRIIKKRHESGNRGKNKMAVNLNINATQDAELQIEIDRSTGDILKTRGTGLVGLSIGGADNKFDIKGNYLVNSGSFKFTLVGGIISRDFTLEPGGTISLNGDIMKSTLNMTANYRTKASLSTLIQDSTASGSRRTVDCKIGISGALSNPELAFNIDIPDLDPSTQGKVSTALNSEEKRMKQVLALLISGSFVPSEEGGIVNSSTILYSNVSEIMSNQFNNIFRQLDIPLDFGFKYQPTSTGRSIFDVAISTQLFNNRVTINGNIGNREYQSSSSSDIVGDVDVQIKLNNSGKLILSLFTHSADKYSNYLDQAQRNGAGMVVREDFDTFRELWRKLFWSKKRKREEDEKARKIISDTDSTR